MEVVHEGAWVRTMNGLCIHPVNAERKPGFSATVVRCQEHPIHARQATEGEVRMMPKCPNCLLELAAEQGLLD